MRTVLILCLLASPIGVLSCGQKGPLTPVSKSLASAADSATVWQTRAR